MKEGDINKCNLLLESFGMVAIKVGSYVSTHSMLSIAIFPDSRPVVYAAMTGCTFLQGNLFAHGSSGIKTTLSLHRNSDNEIKLVGDNFSQVGVDFDVYSNPIVPIDIETAATLLEAIATAANNMFINGAPSSIIQRLLRELAHVAELLGDTEKDHDAEVLATVSQLASSYPGFDRALSISSGLIRRG